MFKDLSVIKLLTIDQFNAIYIAESANEYKDAKHFENHVTANSKMVGHLYKVHEMGGEDNWWGELHIILYNPMGKDNVRFIYTLMPYLHGYHHPLQLINKPDFKDIYYKLKYNLNPHGPFHYIVNFKPKLFI